MIEIDGVEYNIAHKIIVLSHVLTQNINHALAELDLSLTGFKFLFMLDNHGSKSQADLSSWCGITPAAASKRISLLSKNNLISTKTNPKNRKENIISITREGEKILKLAHKILEKASKETLAHGKNLKKLDEELEKLAKPFGCGLS